MAKKKTILEEPTTEETTVEEPTNEAKNDKPVEGEVITKPQTKLEIMKAKLAAQPKVRIIIPKDKHEKEGSFETVQLNGYTYQIKKGVYVEVPQQIADIIMESNKQISEAYDNASKQLSDDLRPQFDNSN